MTTHKALAAALPLLAVIALLGAQAQAQAQDVSAAQVKEPVDDGEPLSLLDADVETTEHGWSRFSASLGYMWLQADGRFEVAVPGRNPIPIIDFDRLGVDDSDGTVTAAMRWRSHDSKWGAWFGYWRFSGAGFRTWADELDLGDGVIVPVGAGVLTELTTDWYILEATYSFIQNERWDAGVGFGVHVVDVGTTLAIGATIGDGQRVETLSTIDTLAPLPNIVGYAQYRLGDRWKISGRYGWFGLSYDDYDGEMTNLIALLQYDVSKRWSIEAGYHFVKLDVDVDEGVYTSIYDLDFNGPTAAISFRF